MRYHGVPKVRSCARFALGMKIPCIYRYSAALLGMWLLVACALPPLWRMNCFKTGRAVVEWFSATPCAMESDASSDDGRLQATCCSYTHATAELAPTLHTETSSTLAMPATPQSALLSTAGLASMAMVVQRPNSHAPPLWRVLHRLALSGQFLL